MSIMTDMAKRTDLIIGKTMLLIGLILVVAGILLILSECPCT